MKNILYLPKSNNLSSRLASRLSLLNCRSISWLIRFCSLASSDRQHAMIHNNKIEPVLSTINFKYNTNFIILFIYIYFIFYNFSFFIFLLLLRSRLPSVLNAARRRRLLILLGCLVFSQYYLDATVKKKYIYIHIFFFKQ